MSCIYIVMGFGSIINPCHGIWELWKINLVTAAWNSIQSHTDNKVWSDLCLRIPDPIQPISGNSSTVELGWHVWHWFHSTYFSYHVHMWMYGFHINVDINYQLLQFSKMLVELPVLFAPLPSPPPSPFPPYWLAIMCSMPPEQSQQVLPVSPLKPYSIDWGRVFLRSWCLYCD